METYERKYKELEGKIKKAYLYAQTDSTKAVLEDILPELAINEDTNWLFYKMESGELVSDTYPINEWYEVEHLSTDLSEPQVIVEDHYTE